MTVILPETNLSRFYDAAPRPFRFTRKTAIAIGVAAVFQGTVGYFAVKGNFAPILITDYPPEHIIETFKWKPEKPPEPPPPKPTDIPPESKPVTLAVRDTPIFRDIPVETLSATPTDARPTDALPTEIAPDPKPLPVAPSIPKPDPLIRNPSWVKKPTPDQISSLYPTRAIERGIGGGATLLCQVAETGVVSNCAVVDESPKGYRFGEAALAMTRYFRMNPRTVDGAIQAGSRVRIPIVFNPG